MRSSTQGKVTNDERLNQAFVFIRRVMEVSALQSAIHVGGLPLLNALM